ncbi:hypothetical protein [Aestuariibacter salexigens]|uniref:hypothetical protein n=1 Tax=Aestuariibacter salexigens TaxID=226010 RepID=UPI000421209A|nr:hypothetical protein [Aestuariibacter salexigens]
MKSSTMLKILTLTVFGTLGYVEDADARLVVGGGVGRQTDTAPQAIHLVDDSLFYSTFSGTYGNGTPYQTATILLDEITGVLGTSPTFGYTSGDLFLSAVPKSDCILEFSTPEEYDAERQYNADAFGECVWEYKKGEQLFAFGSFPFFDPFAGLGLDYVVNWTISNTAGESWLFNSKDEAYIGSGIAPYGDPNMVFLDAAMPRDLMPGDYFLNISVDIFSGNGRTFLYEDLRDESSDCIENCEIDAVEDPLLVKRFDAYDVFTLGAYVSDGRVHEGIRLRVVNEPTTLLILLAGLTVSLTRRNLLTKNKS